MTNGYSEYKKHNKACEIVDEDFEDIFQYSVVGKGQSKLKSVNLLGRLNEEVRRIEKVICIFPNHAFVTYLIGAVLIDCHEERLTPTRKYVQF